jgi:hypothetical protein
MCTAYSFESSLKYCCQLIPILPRDARHPGSIMKLKKQKNTGGVVPFETQILCEKEN